ncbi:ATP-dependent nuclease [Lewinella sp. IMCC34191]|uniref:ATP-dependent nuclease n=1 Tax=Lewinella sp. IMCC34191 TaxID=2259172 RepID=UPI000E23604B|nr:AAA family ATPase [Lewinella sp. IMCC34191]
MEVTELSVKGFKCYNDSGPIPFHNLTVFIGENDAGKSSIFDALELILSNKNPSLKDFREDIDNIEVTIKLQPSEGVNDVTKYLCEGKLCIRRTVSKSFVSYYECFGEVYEDDALNDYQHLSATSLKELLKRYSLPSASNQVSRKAIIEEFLLQNESLPKHRTWKQIKYDEISGFFPIFQRFASSDYGNPESVIRKTLEIAYRHAFYDHDDEGNEFLKPRFKTLKQNITLDLDNKLENQLLRYIQKYKPEIQAIKGSYNIEFSRGLSFTGLNIVDDNSNEKSIVQIGEGSKKKIFLSILEWDAEINLINKTNKYLIRGYDEPDSNLHYEAQRQMFYVIKNLAEDPTSRVQSLICTHSLTMIDRAPAKNINHIVKNEQEGKSHIEYLRNFDKLNVESFLHQVSEIAGIRNSSIFYEKCFLLVEGESEENAIPILYKKYCGKHLIEDGIVLVNLQTNGQWSNALKFLQSNRQNCTVVLLDKDTQYSTSRHQVTVAKLEEIGFDGDFLTNHCFFVGHKEFEDIFTDAQLARTANRAFPKADGSAWEENDFAIIRQSAKFSKSLKDTICRLSQSSPGKPKIALEIANDINKNELLHFTEIISTFHKVTEIIK